jgi:alkylation response protein AidB-like acyl-CoA dehydrogenase
MHFAFSNEQLEMRNAISRALSSKCTPEVVRASWETPNSDLWPFLAELGMLGINASLELGGQALGPTDWVLLLEESGKVALPNPLVEAIAAVPFLEEAGEDALAERVISGKATVSIAYENGYAGGADTAELILRTRGDEVMAVRNPGLTAQPASDGSRRLFSVNGQEEVLAGNGEALVQRAILATSAQLLGLGFHLLDTAVAYARVRTQFGKAIGSFQAVQHHLVDALLKLRFAAPMVYRAAESLEEGSAQAGLHISMAKIYASEAAQFVCRKSLQVHGAIGYTYEMDLHLWMKRVWALSADWGDAATHRNNVAGKVLGESHG